MNNILTNLIIISKIKPDDKIYINSDNYISIEMNNNIQGIIRFLFGNSRHKNINSLIQFYELVWKYMDDTLNSRYLLEHEDENYELTLNNLTELYEYSKKSIIGLENLKKTYSDDIVTSSKLDIIIGKLNSYIKKIDTKITI